MSHFSTLVIVRPGETLDALLQPFHEFECTGINDQFIQDIDVTQDYANDEAEIVMTASGLPRSSTLIARLKENRIEVLGAFETPDFEAEHQFGYAREDEDGKIIRVFRRTNPNAKWDWWVIGGRFSNRLRDSDGKQCDTVLKSKLDFRHAYEQFRKEAGEHFDTMRKVVGDNTWKTIGEMLETAKAYAEMTAEEIVERDVYRLYWEQPGVQKVIAILKANDPMGAAFMQPKEMDMLLKPRESFIAYTIQRRIPTFAVVDKNGWHQSAEMHWFGITSDEMNVTEWFNKFAGLIGEAPDDATLTVVDCHI